MRKKHYPLILMLLFATLQVHAQSWNELIKIVAPDRTNNDNFGYSVAVDGDYAVVGSPYDSEDAAGLNYKQKAGSAYILKNTAGTWSILKKIVASDRGALDYFGYSVSISGNYILIGAPFEDEDADGLNTLSEAGSIYIFNKDEGGTDNWGQTQKITANDRGAGDHFGSSVSVSGDNAAVGAPFESEDESELNTLSGAGSVYILMNFSGTWYQFHKKVPFDRAMYDNFGFSVAVSGNNLIVGSPYDSEDENNANTMSQAGSVYIFNKDQGSANAWGFVQKLAASDRGVEDNYGLSVAISGDYAVVGSPYDDEDENNANYIYNTGSAYILYNNTGTWNEVQKVVASDRASQDIYAYSVAVSGDYACIGAYWENSKAGAAYFVQNNGGTWSELQKVTASDAAASDNFGNSVSVSGNYAFIGSPLEDQDAAGANTLSNSGSSYIFNLQTPPVITSDPSDQTNVCPSGNAIFNVAGDNVDSYQWQVSQNSGTTWTDITDNSIYSGSQTDSLYVICYISLNNYQYRCVLTNTTGNTTSNAALLTISDNEAPVPNISTLSDVTAECEVTSLTAPTANDACAGTITGTHNVTLPITTQGTTVVTWTYDDGNGNTSSQTQNVVIEDVTAPVPNVSNLSDVTVECEVTSLTAPTANDACAGTITGTHDAVLPITTQGTTTVTWTYDDGNGNTSSQTQDIVINDVTAPVPNVSNLSDVTVECEVTSLTAPTANDACAGTITGTHDAVLPVTTQGTTVVTWTYDDGNGNTSSQTQDVVIEDVTAPTITCIGNQTVDADDTHSYTVQGTEFDLAETTDNCGIASVENNFNNTETLENAQLPEGTTTITWTITDFAGNTNTCSFDVTVSAYVGIETLQQKGISVYPNPTNGKINIVFNNNSIQKITISDITGKQILSKNKIRKNEQIDLSDFTGGIYIISIQTEKEILTTRIIKR